jgi:hypothetical protein
MYFKELKDSNSFSLKRERISSFFLTQSCKVDRIFFRKNERKNLIFLQEESDCKEIIKKLLDY